MDKIISLETHPEKWGLEKRGVSPAQSANIPETLQSVLNELNAALARYEADFVHEAEENTFACGCHAGYRDGLKRAISIVQYEIGIRQNPPNISYGMEEEL